MTRLIACLLLLAVAGCGGGGLAKTRMGSDGVSDAAAAIHAVSDRPLADAKSGCGRDVECLKPWLKAEAAVKFVDETAAAFDAATSSAELVEGNAMGSINCVAAAVARAIRALEVVGIRSNSRAMRTWSRFFGTLETMCLYSTEATLGHGSAEGEQP